MMMIGVRQTAGAFWCGNPPRCYRHPLLRRERQQALDKWDPGFNAGQPSGDGQAVEAAHVPQHAIVKSSTNLHSESVTCCSLKKGDVYDHQSFRPYSGLFPRVAASHKFDFHPSFPFSNHLYL